ncbi:hypothetical protein [Bacillus sp. Marseille-P3661]|uniref:hypothetical protein n=1 Tax=Bacillus sp. Marseille-P3661 TaxID=1936234 RepID=UPI000C821B23|nr:hypothetical protein [Bacillus sp. Marseille-P3661]
MTEYEAGGLVMLSFGALILFLLLLIIPYILSAVGLYNMAKRAQINNEWLAFVPIGNSYIIGELIDNKLQWFPFGSSGGVKLLIVTVGTIIINFIPILGTIIAFLIGIFWFVVFHWLYQKYSDSAVLLTIITVLTGGLAACIFIFALRNKEPLN